MKLHEKEIDNDESIIEMYEQMLEYERKEMKRINETAKAYENASELGREELDAALKKVRDLESQNAELKKQKIESLNK
jgi:Arc/MetJ-type ribon-helix-helix transcriptional regulator